MIDALLRRPSSPGDLVADALRLIGLLSVGIAAIAFTATDAGILAFALPALLAPRALGLRSSFDIVFVVVVLVAAWSNVLDLYRSVPGWDLVVHVVCTAVIAAALYLGLARACVVAAPGRQGFRARTPIVIVTALGLAVSALWEMVEWAGYTFITDEIFVTYDDTIGDMAVGGLGALAAGFLVAHVRLERSTVNPLRGEDAEGEDHGHGRTREG